MAEASEGWFFRGSPFSKASLDATVKLLQIGSPWVGVSFLIKDR